MGMQAGLVDLYPPRPRAEGKDTEPELELMSGGAPAPQSVVDVQALGAGAKSKWAAAYTALHAHTSSPPL